MKILLDECIDRRLVRCFNGLSVKTVPQMGWASFKNGKILALAENEFDIFVTVDRNLSFQQNTINLNLAIIVLKTKSNRVSDLEPLIPEVLLLLPLLEPGQVRFVGT
ncbi:MAG TPA: DUF5615 family PIN-like protein [Oligoflexia bacterium]|nr:DUF5615 family PIN-like protein [Oligoflexia bacterium]